MKENQLSADAVKRILAFRDARDWSQFHNPKDLAISLSLESAELLECFQWSGADLDVEKKRAAMAEEIADVMIYAVLMADRLGFDIDEIVKAKIDRNNSKYPQDLAKGSKEKYTELKGKSACR